MHYPSATRDVGLSDRRYQRNIMDKQIFLHCLYHSRGFLFKAGILALGSSQAASGGHVAKATAR